MALGEMRAVLIGLSLGAAGIVLAAGAVAASAATSGAMPGVTSEAISSTPPAGAGLVAVANVPPAALPGAKVRTTSRIELLLARELAGGPDATLLSAPDPVEALDAGRGAGVWLGVWPARQPVPAGVVRQSLNYAVGPAAIMRGDTTIHDWKALATRTVCVVEGEPYVGEIAERFGALEQRYPSATDALLAVRTGKCDAGVMSDRLLEALRKFPEWKKFSARLPAYRHADLVWVSTQAGVDAGWSSRLQALTPAKLAAVTTQQARDIAFEVYLDQVVPDCH